MFAVAQNSKPAFVNGFSQLFHACQNDSASIDSIMVIADADSGQIENWGILSAPLHGTLTGFSTSAPSTGTTTMPTGLSYTPAAGYTGGDTFTIEIFDGIDTGTTTVYVTIDSTPMLSSSLTPFTICDNTYFNYTPTSTTPGAVFTWSRPFIAGISNMPGTGIGNPFELLYNTTYYSIPVTYVYSISANGCTNIENVVVRVRPTPKLTSSMYDTVCSGGTLSYVPTSSAAGTNFSWSRAVVDGISPASSTGLGNITESLINSADTAITAVYELGLEDSGCTSLSNLYVLVDPQPHITTITTDPGTSLCSGTMYQNFGAGIPAPPGVTYSWSVVNGYVFAKGSGSQFCLVNFPNPGTAYVVLTIFVTDNDCVVHDTVAVNVDSSFFTPAGIIYYNYQFVYEDNSINDYQWGYDDAVTLDSTAIAGAQFQSYVNPSPDFLNKHYWVIVSKNGCTQKIYYNPPMAVANVTSKEVVSIAVSPNPASDQVKVDMRGLSADHATLMVTDMLGRVVESREVTGQASAMMDVAPLPAGCYLLSCYEHGQKMAVTKFVKN